ncbi:MAG TPA: helix-turn-helix transcriptional regulator [Acidothermaceae bacterium]|nr:helix-turn-helix transcriptional regulator [Acidothermaceae bacterium]
MTDTPGTASRGGRNRTLGAALRARLAELGHSQVEAAVIMGLSEPQMTRFLNRGQVPLDEVYLDAIRKYLDVSEAEMGALIYWTIKRRAARRDNLD